MKKFIILTLIFGGICTACYINLSLKEKKMNHIKNALALADIPCEIGITKFQRDDFSDVSTRIEFNFDKKFIPDLLKGREWVAVEDVNDIKSMEGAMSGYTWAITNEHAEIAFFIHESTTQCKLYYHLE